MHILDAIGTGGSRSMSVIAKSVGVTVGTLTIAMNSLVKKGYVARIRSEEYGEWYSSLFRKRAGLRTIIMRPFI